MLFPSRWRVDPLLLGLRTSRLLSCQVWFLGALSAVQLCLQRLHIAMTRLGGTPLCSEVLCLLSRCVLLQQSVHCARLPLLQQVQVQVRWQ
jgi:hypothetical protein